MTETDNEPNIIYLSRPDENDLKIRVRFKRFLFPSAGIATRLPLLGLMIRSAVPKTNNGSISMNSSSLQIEQESWAAELDFIISTFLFLASAVSTLPY